MIRVQNLSLIKIKNGEKNVLLQDLFLEIPSERITLFLGKSGSGKTSLLRCLTHVESNYSGEISCCGKPLSKMTRKERCRLIGLVPQTYALVPFMTVLENCTHPLRTVLKISKEAAIEKVHQQAISLGVQSLLASYPHELSGGQQQRAAILRALLLDPMFLLFDEPTSALDPENATLFVQIIKKLRREGKGIVIVTHDMQIVKQICDNVYFLQNGKVVEYHDMRSNSEISKQSLLGNFLLAGEKEMEESLLALR